MQERFSIEAVAARISVVRGKRVLIDRDLAQLYGVATMRLNEQVKRNRNRFPDDFMFQITREEAINLRPQFAMSSWGGRRHLPYVFTEQGVAMLSSVLRSDRAVQVNIAIMRAFVKLREFLLTHRDLAEKLEALGRRVDKHDERINAVFEAIKQLLLAPAQSVTKSSTPVSKPQIGFNTD